MEWKSPQFSVKRLACFLACRSVRKGVALLVATTFLFSTVAISAQTPKITPLHGPSVPIRNNGQTLFGAIFYGDGALAQQIPTLRTTSKYLTPEYKSYQAPAIAYIQAHSPTFFETFANQISSGDRVQIAAAIKSASALNREALLDATKTSKTDFALKLKQLKNTPTPGTAEDNNVGFQVVVWLVVFVVLAVWLLKELPADVKGLNFDQFVDEIARAVPAKK